MRWGLSATGKIAATMAQTLRQMPDAQLVAVASREQSRADDFARQFSIAWAFSDHKALCECPDVDIIYIASPHSEHYWQAKMALEHGKHVLCEKPLTLDVVQAEALFKLASARGLFMMEAMWMLFFPAIQALKQLIASKRLGRVLHLDATFAIDVSQQPEHRLNRLELGGGALLDVGIYPLTLATYLLGEPQYLESEVKVSTQGVDSRSRIDARFAGEVTACLRASIVDPRCIEARVRCEQGVIILAPPFHCTHQLILTDLDGACLEVLDFPYEGTGYEYEVAAVHQAIHEQRLLCDTVPPKDSLSRLVIMCDLLRQWGVHYPLRDA